MYIFGIDLPIAEMMTVFFLILFLAIWLIYYEIRNLSKLFDEEKSDISKLDSELHLVDQILACGKPHEALSSYVVQKITAGHSVDRVKENLINAGFHKDVINKAVQAGKSQVQNIATTPSSVNKVSSMIQSVKNAHHDVASLAGQEVRKSKPGATSLNELEEWLHDKK